MILIIWVPGCLIAGWWQATVALSGNVLSYLYAVEWPLFAIMGVIAWWYLIHDGPGYFAKAMAEARHAAKAPGAKRTGGPEISKTARRRDLEDAKLAAYNDYLASLAAADRAKSRSRAAR